MTKRMVWSAIGAALIAMTGPCIALAADVLPYDLIFRTGTLDTVPRNAELVYDRTVMSHADPSRADAETGEVHLDLGAVGANPGTVDNAGAAAVLDFVQGKRHRQIGSFPAKVGNPIGMYFAETLVAEMARIAGGSPFYIRNQIKKALARPTAVTETAALFGDRQITVSRITIQPFVDDPHREQMAGFDKLEITATFSDDVPGWFRSLDAVVPEAPGEPLWQLTLKLQPPQKEVK